MRKFGVTNRTELAVAFASVLQRAALAAILMRVSPGWGSWDAATLAELMI
jgi:hypothetical protein